MISSVFVSGRLGAVDKDFDDIRYVEVDRIIPSEGGSYAVDRFPVRSYNGPQGSLMVAPKGALIIMKARIEMDEHLGLILQDEIDEIFPMGSK